MNAALLLLASSVSSASIAPDDATALGVEAYSYLFPLVLLDVTRGDSQPNTIHSLPRFLPPRVHEVVRPNVDTLYSTAWLDLAEPVVLSVPDTNGAYYELQLLDLWSNTFAAPGKRTYGTAARDFLITGPRWNGTAPPGATVIRSSTEGVWMIGRTQCNGTEDYDAVHAIQRGFKLAPLSALQPQPPPPQHPQQPQQQRGLTPPVVVFAMDARTFFTAAASLMARNPATPADAPFLQRVFAPLGLPTDGAELDWDALDETTRAALNASVPLAKAAIAANASTAPGATVVAGWRYPPADLGGYGTDYALRSATALSGLGANLVADAVYLSTEADLLPGQQLKLTFASAAALPPVNAFWSFTAYNSEGYLQPNSLGRYALHSWDPLTHDGDGSLTLYFGDTKPPPPAAAANWLPCPSDGKNWTITVRLYWPQEAIINRSWALPPLEIQARQR